MHSDFFDKIYVYPGIVDYEDFHVLNFIFSPLKECEFTIWAGTPLLQVIPYKRENITATVGKGDDEDRDSLLYKFLTRKPGTYRKLFHKRKKYTILK
jgi:hypothetical protein